MADDIDGLDEDQLRIRLRETARLAKKRNEAYAKWQKKSQEARDAKAVYNKAEDEMLRCINQGPQPDLPFPEPDADGEDEEEEAPKRLGFIELTTQALEEDAKASFMRGARKSGRIFNMDQNIDLDKLKG